MVVVCVSLSLSFSFSHWFFCIFCVHCNGHIVFIILWRTIVKWMKSIWNNAQLWLQPLWSGLHCGIWQMTRHFDIYQTLNATFHLRYDISALFTWMSSFVLNYGASVNWNELTNEIEDDVIWSFPLWWANTFSMYDMWNKYSSPVNLDKQTQGGNGALSSFHKIQKTFRIGCFHRINHISSSLMKRELGVILAAFCCQT